MVLCIGFYMKSHACNSCGSSSGGQSLGLLPAMQKHFAGLQFQQKGFKSIHPALIEGRPAEKSEEVYTTLQLWGRYQLSKRVQLFGFVPYQYNLQYKSETTTSINGWGDVTLLANIAVLSKTKGIIRHTLLAGGGIKAPTGKRDSISLNDKNGLPNMQPGSGAWDFVVNANYTMQSGKWGANAEGSYTFTTTSKDSYKYGNKLSAGMLAFYRIAKGPFIILPQAGFRCEYALHDYDNYKRKWLNEQTGGYQLFLNSGLQAYYKRAGLQLGYMFPLAQNYAAGNVTINTAINAGVFLLL